MFKEYRDKWKALSSPVKWASRIAALLVIYTLVGFFLIPFVSQKILQDQLPKVLKRNVTIEDVDFNPYTLNMRVKGFQVAKKDGDGNLLAFKQLSVNLDSFSIFRLALIVTDVTFNDLYVDVSLYKGSTSVSDLIPESEDKNAEEDSSGSLFPFVVDNFNLTNGTIKVFDQPKDRHHLISDINISVPFTSTLSRNVKDFVKPSLSAVINGTPVSMKGKTLPFDSSLRTQFSFVLQKAELKDYRVYLPLPEEVQIKSGTLSSTLSLVFDRGGESRPKITLAGEAEIENFDLDHSKKGRLLGFKDFKFKFDDLSLFKRIFHVNSVMLLDPYVQLALKPDGSPELLDYLIPENKVESAPSDFAAETPPASNSTEEIFNSTSSVAVSSSNASQVNSTEIFSAGNSSITTVSDESPVKVADVSENASNETEIESEKNDESEDTEMFLVTIDHFDMTGGIVDFKDNAFGKGYEKKVGPISLGGLDITTGRAKYGNFSLEIGTKGKEFISTKGRISLNPLDVDGELGVSNMTIPDYHNYYEDALPLDVSSGSLNVNAAYRFTPPAKGMNATTVVSGLAVKLNSLKMNSGKERKSPVIGLDSLGISNGTIDLNHRSLAVGSVDLNGGLIRISRDKKGIDLVKLIGETQKVNNATSTAEKDNLPTGNSTADAPAWNVGVRNINIDGTSFEFIDNAATDKTVLKLGDINVRADNFSLAGDEDMSVDVRAEVNERGSFALNGKVRMNPMSAAGTVNMRKIRLRDFNGYLPPQMEMNIARGHIDVNGDWDFNAADKPVAGYRGKVQLKDLLVRDSTSNKSVFTLSELAVRDIDFKSDPLSGTVGLVNVINPVTNIVREQDGTINLSRMMTGRRAAPVNATAIDEQAEKVAVKSGLAAEDQSVKDDANLSVNATVTDADAGSDASFMLDRVSLTNGTMVFKDLTVKPNFNMDISKMQANITRLGLPYGNRTGIVFNATVDDQSPLILSGELLPVGKTFKSGMRLSLSNLDMTQLSPYTLKYIAYPVSTGMLNADVDLKLQGTEVAVGNLFDIYQFDVGSKVPNPDAANVPIGLGLALLKDSSGNIQLDIPVVGDLSDPQFRLGAVIGRAIVNLLIKAVTSPFALIGSIFGGGEDMNVLAFDPGTDKLNEKALKKIETIAKAMKERPGLNLEISGFTATQVDRPALEELTFRRKIAMVKYLELEGDENAPKTVDDVVITAEEYPEYLEDVYKDEPFEKPTNLIGMVKTLPVPEMEKAVRDHIDITPSDLSQLARRRAEKVRDLLINEKGISAGRVYLKDSTQVKAQSAGPRVELGLK